MKSKKNKSPDDIKKSSKKKSSKIDNDELSDLGEFDLIDDDYVEDDILGEIDEEDEEQEVLSHVKEYEKDIKKRKLINVYEKIGKPKLKSASELLKEDVLNEEYKNLLYLLDKNSIVVHFKNDYQLREKYRFIVEEVFKQDIEDFKKSKVHFNFIYEDFHPEKDFEEDDEEDYY